MIRRCSDSNQRYVKVAEVRRGDAGFLLMIRGEGESVGLLTDAAGEPLAA